MNIKKLKIALVHDFLIRLGGAERVLKVFSDLFPEAPIYTLLYDEKKVGDFFPKERVNTSFLQKYPRFIRKRHRLLINKMPRAIEELDFSGYDLVLSSSNSYSHGIITNFQTKHICYCHSPMRYAWDWSNEYVRENNIVGLKKVLYMLLIKYLREWDRSSADRPDLYLANSKNVKRRIKKYYGLSSEVVYPPVNVQRFSVNENHLDYFLIVSNLSPFKNVELAVKLFNKIGKKLIIIGSGPQKAYLKSISAPNIDFLGFKSDESVKEYMENCRAFIFPGEEDFGITPLEAMSAGKPVLAYGKGGALETVIAGKTGEFFYEEDIDSIEDGLARLLYNEKFYDANEIREHADKFSEDVFKENIMGVIKEMFK